MRRELGEVSDPPPRGEGGRAAGATGWGPLGEHEAAGEAARTPPDPRSARATLPTRGRDDGRNPPSTLVVACGALAREFLAAKQLNGLEHLEVTCLPGILHNRPERIPDALRRKIRAGKRTHDHVLVLYGDCGTGGLIDKVCAEEGVERIEGEHCYAFFLGLDTFAEEHEREIGTFYLTDYLVRHFDRLIVQGLGLDRYPQLRDAYFEHYTRVLYLAQTDDERLTEKARAAADRLGLAFERRYTGIGGVSGFLERAAARRG